MNRASSLITVLALVAMDCGSGSGSPEPPGESTAGPTVPSLGALPEGPSALDDMNDPAFAAPLIDPAEIISGGPPPDGIPPIDDPHFLAASEATERFTDDEPVVALVVGDDARAYAHTDRTHTSAMTTRTPNLSCSGAM